MHCHKNVINVTLNPYKLKRIKNSNCRGEWGMDERSYPQPNVGTLTQIVYFL
jgi:hypothetical protein